MRLIIFDCDGTLVDSQRTIVTCGKAAFRKLGLEEPSAEAIRRIVGLSLVEAMEVLIGRRDLELAEALSDAYKEHFHEHREAEGFSEPLFPGTLELLRTLQEREILLGVATGKSMRGLRLTLEHHALEDYFVTLQTADLHPSKPHPSMVIQAMAETGSDPKETMLIGDTSFDIEMAVAAGCLPVGVNWGNHPGSELEDAGAHRVVNRFEQVLELLP